MLPPLWSILGSAGIIAFDCCGGVVVDGGHLRFRKYFRVASIPVESIDSVLITRGVGFWGTLPVVTVKLKGGGRCRVGALASIEGRQVVVAARQLAHATEARAPR